jgi:hypothetical protein
MAGRWIVSVLSAPSHSHRIVVGRPILFDRETLHRRSRHSVLATRPHEPPRLFTSRQRRAALASMNGTRTGRGVFTQASRLTAKQRSDSQRQKEAQTGDDSIDGNADEKFVCISWPKQLRDEKLLRALDRQGTPTPCCHCFDLYCIHFQTWLPRYEGLLQQAANVSRCGCTADQHLVLRVIVVVRWCCRSGALR